MGLSSSDLSNRTFFGDDGMNWIESIVLVAVLALVAFAFYEGFVHHRKEPCGGCPYAKNCSGSCAKKEKCEER